MKLVNDAFAYDQPYTPNASLVKYFFERLQLETERQYLTLDGKELPQEKKKALHNSERMKNYILNKIVFPSMANLLFFFESVSRDDNLHELFKDDLVELLELVGPPTPKESPRSESDESFNPNQEDKKKKYEHVWDLYKDSIIARLTGSLLFANTVVGEIKNSEYRLVVANIMQQKLTDKLNQDLANVIKDEELKQLVRQEATWAKALMQLCASRVSAINAEATRKFDIPYLEAKEDAHNKPIVRMFRRGEGSIPDEEINSFLPKQSRRKQRKR